MEVLCMIRISILEGPARISWAALIGGAVASSVDAGTHRFDHVEFESFAGGHTTVVAINQSGLVTGSSGGAAVQDRHAFVSDSTGKLTSINTLGLSSSTAAAISDAGHVAGIGCIMNDQSCQPIAFRYSAATGMQDLGMLSGGHGVVVTGVNALGHVIGFWVVGEESVSQAFVFTDENGLQGLGSLGGGSTWPGAINNASAIVGDSRVGPLPSHRHAFHWQTGVMIDLGTFGGVSSFATDISESGIIVGTALDETFNSHAFVFTDENGLQTLSLPKDATSSGALMVNEAGMVLVSFMRENFNAGMALVKLDGGTIDIPLLDGFPTGSAIAMNNVGHIIGANVKVIGSNEIVSAFYWSEETGTIQLDDAIISDLPWTIFNPVAINDADEILVHGFVGDDERSAFLRPALAGDVNGDRVITIDDLLAVINAWGQCPAAGSCAADFEGDGVVNIDDLLTVINNWGSPG
jgi:probable HAF family extracellular repeat protein